MLEDYFEGGAARRRWLHGGVATAVNCIQWKSFNVLKSIYEKAPCVVTVLDPLGAGTGILLCGCGAVCTQRAGASCYAARLASDESEQDVWEANDVGLGQDFVRMRDDRREGSRAEVSQLPRITTWGVCQYLTAALLWSCIGSALYIRSSTLLHGANCTIRVINRSVI